MFLQPFIGHDCDEDKNDHEGKLIFQNRSKTSKDAVIHVDLNMNIAVTSVIVSGIC